MKKLFLIALAALMCAPAFAQRSTSSLYSTSNDVLSINSLSHWGWGYSFVQSDAFKPAGSGEFFLNILDFKFYPVEEFGLEFGLDCKWSYTGSKESMFIQNDHIVKAVPFVIPGKTIEKTRSQISIFSLSVPVLAKFVLNRFRIGGGAGGNFKPGGGTI